MKYYITTLEEALAQMEIINLKARHIFTDGITTKLAEVKELTNNRGGIPIVGQSNGIYLQFYKEEHLIEARDLTEDDIIPIENNLPTI